jgi:hypothetical protein
MRKLLIVLLAVSLGATLFVQRLNAQVTITNPANVGPTALNSTYTTLDLAIADLNTKTSITGPVTITLDAGNPQTAPAGGYSITAILADASLVNMLTIEGSGNTITASSVHTVGALNDAVFKIIGGDFMILQNFTMLENAANTTTTAGTNNMTEFGVALFYASTTNGCQNITIKNNTITLNRTYQNTFGIYSNSTHSATAMTTSATATGAAGGNHNLVITGNTISNVNNGIIVVGPTAAADMNNVCTIGGSGNVNTISNYGTTGTFSGYVNVSGTINGILVRNTKDFTLSYNSISSSVGGVTAGTLNGIQVPAFSNAPTGTFTNSISNNSISLQSGLIAGGMTGINVGGTSASITSAININNNNFHTFGHTVAGTGAITFITQAGTHLSQSISNNTFTNINVNTTGSVTFISNSVTLPASGTQNINDNAIVTAFSKTGAGGTVILFTSNASSSTGSTINNNNNNFSNITVTGATTINGWSNTDGGTPSKTIQGNTFNNWIGGTSAITVLNIGYTAAGSIVSGNTINNITGQGAISGLVIGSSSALNAYSNNVNSITSTGTGGAVIGISITSGSNNVYQNVVLSLSTTSSAAVTGISVSGATLHNIYKNRIGTLENTNTGGAVNGILVSGGTNIYVYNNLISELRAPNATTASEPIAQVRGINITSTTASSTVGLYYNTIYLDATANGANFGSSGVFHTFNTTAGNASLDMRNNIIYNVSQSTGTGRTVAFRRSAATNLNNYGTASDNNLLYAGAGDIIYFDGTTPYNLDNFKTLVAPREANSVTGTVPFLSVNSVHPDYLKIDPTVATYAESGGKTVTTPVAIADDYWGDTRAATPDIGADEFNGIAAGLVNPSITATTISSQEISLAFTLNPDNDDIVILYNTVNSFGVPSGSPPSNIDDPFAGAFFLYQGQSSPVAHTGLTPGITYYYKAFSYDGSNYSSGVAVSASTNIAAPATFTATAFSASQINLAWTKNTIGHNIIVAVNSTNTFGQPDNGTAYAQNDLLPTAGTVIYNGSASGYNHTPLTSNTTYFYKAWSVDSYDFYSASGLSASATTFCDVENAPTVVQDFSTYTGAAPPPGCWSEATGVLAANSTLTYVNSEWTSSTGFANTGTNKGVKVNLYSTGNDWLISQAIDLGSTAGLYNVKYRIAVTSYNGTVAQSTMGTHKVDIVISTDGGSTWSNTNVIRTYTGAGAYSNTGQEETINLTAYSGVVKFAFVETTSSSTPDIDFHIDDFVVELIPSCPAPTTQTVTALTAVGADLGWTSAASFFDVYVQGAATPAPDESTTPTADNVSGNSYTWAGGSPATTYYWWVRTDCDAGGESGVSTWTGPNSFTTVATPPYFEGFEAGNTHNTAIVGWTQEAAVGTDTWTANNTLTDYNRTPKTGSWNAFLRYSNTRWMFKAFYLTQGVAYDFEMYARQDGATAANSNITISYGSAGNAAAMTNVIIPETGIINGNYQQLQGSFTPSSTGVHYIGIKGFMNGTPWYISIDDISLTEASTATLSWYNLQWPQSANIGPYDNLGIYAQCWEDGVTNLPGAGSGIECWIGYNTINATDVSDFASGWTWVLANYNQDVGNNDEYMANLGATQGLGEGTYYYVSRFRYNNGPFTYGGFNGGAWNGNTNVSGEVTVSCPEINLPYTEDFEAMNTSFSCWSVMGNTEAQGGLNGNSLVPITGNTWFVCTPASFSGAGATYIHTGTRSAAIGYTALDFNWLVSKNINMPASGSVNLKFWIWYHSTTDITKFYVNVFADGVWSTVLTYNSTSNGNQYASQVVVPLDAYIGKVIKVAFVYEYNDGWQLAVDDISIKVAPTSATWTGTISNSWTNTGNWTTDVPGSITDVTIPGGLTNYPTLTAAASCNNFTIQSGASGTGSIIGNHLLTIGGAATVQRYLTQYNDIEDKMFHFISSPVAAQAIREEFVTNTPTAGHDFYSFGELTNMWINTKDGSGNWNSAFENNFVVGKGYLVAYPANVTKNFTGTLNSYASPLVLNCTNTADPGGNGWNLLGNPFPSAIDWTLVSLGDGIDNALYYYDNAQQNYRYYLNPISGDETSLGSGQRYIPAMQGFMVHAKTTGAQTVSISNAARTHLGQDVFYKSTASVPGSLSLKVTANGYEDAAFIHFNQNATTAFDGSYDAYKLRSYSNQVPMIFTKGSDGSELAINGMPELESSTVIPVYFNTALNGNFVLTADLTGLNNAHTYLQDLKLNHTQNLSENPVYSFTASPGDDANRFKLTFGSVGIDDPATASSITVYTHGETLYIGGLEAKAEISVINLTGQVVMSSRTNGSGLHTLNAASLAKGVYLVSVISNGQAISRKVVL